MGGLFLLCRMLIAILPPIVLMFPNYRIFTKIVSRAIFIGVLGFIHIYLSCLEVLILPGLLFLQSGHLRDSEEYLILQTLQVRYFISSVLLRIALLRMGTGYIRGVASLREIL